MTTNRLTFRAAAFGLAFSGLLALTACGGDDSGSSDTTKAETTETTVDGAATDETTSPADTDETTAPADTSDIDPLSAQECEDLQNEFTSVFGDLSGDDASLSQIEEVFDRLKDVVPDDLKGDVDILAEAYGKFAEVAEAAQEDPTDPAVQEALAGISTPEVSEASARLEAFFANCETD